MAAKLGLSQSRISHLEKGARESGPVAKLLDALEAEIAAEKHPISAPAEAAR